MQLQIDSHNSINTKPQSQTTQVRITQGSTDQPLITDGFLYRNARVEFDRNRNDLSS
jgi:hypothetical protein